MRIDYLYYYCDLMETGSISKTAAKFFMSPQGLSRAINTLEAEFGVDLLNRKSNAISVSPAGQEFAQLIPEIISAFEKTQHAMKKHTVKDLDFSNPLITVFATPFFFSYIYPLIHNRLEKYCPKLKMVETNIYRLIPHVVNAKSKTSLGIVSRPRLPRNDEFFQNALAEQSMCYEPLISIELQVLISSFSPLAKKERITLEDIRKYPVVVYNDTVLMGALFDILPDLNITLVTNNDIILISQLLHNQAITFFPAIYAAKTLPNNTILVPFENAYHTEVGFIASQKNFLNIDVMETLTCIRGIFEDLSENSTVCQMYRMLNLESETFA